jgi:ubiquinone/menaquinone biosynthesis C-methylase UbiE
MTRSDIVWQRPELAELFTSMVRAGIPLAQEQLDLVLRIARGVAPEAQAVLDLGCGDGILGRMLLSAYPRARCVFLDFSPPMLDLARKALAKDGLEARAQLVSGDLGGDAWADPLNDSRPFDLVVSGFSIHHQLDEQKRRIYGRVFELLKPGGVFLNLEHVASTSSWAHGLFEELMVDSLHAHQVRMGLKMSKEEVAQKWRRRPDNSANILGGLDDQCAWLRELGFVDVDCFFKVFELALFGGIKPPSGR